MAILTRALNSSNGRSHADRAGIDVLFALKSTFRQLCLHDLRTVRKNRLAASKDTCVIQEAKAHGWEGRLAPAWLEWHSISGGKPPFLTCETGTSSICP